MQLYELKLIGNKSAYINLNEIDTIIPTEYYSYIVQMQYSKEYEILIPEYKRLITRLSMTGVLIG